MGRLNSKTSIYENERGFQNRDRNGNMSSMAKGEYGYNEVQRGGYNQGVRNNDYQQGSRNNDYSQGSRNNNYNGYGYNNNNNNEGPIIK